MRACAAPVEDRKYRVAVVRAVFSGIAMSADLASRLAVPVVERGVPVLALIWVLMALFTPGTQAALLPVLAGMLLAAWPLSLAERALGARVQKPLLTGMQVLTREADAARAWRVLSWSSLGASLLATALVALLGGWLLTRVWLALGELPAGISEEAAWSALSVLVLGAGVLRHLARVPVVFWLLPVAALLVTALLPWPQWQLRPVFTAVLPGVALTPDAALWFGAVLGGGGLGVYWQRATQVPEALPLPARVLGLALMLSLLFLLTPLMAALLGAMAAVLAITLLLQPARAAAEAAGLETVQALAVILLPSLLLVEVIWYFLDPHAITVLARGLALWMSANLLVLAIYVGWVMKISHVRKALKLPSEGLYNGWRILVRWVAPLLLLTGCGFWLQSLVTA